LKVFNKKKYDLTILLVIVIAVNITIYITLYSLYLNHYNKEKTIITEIADLQVSIIRSVAIFDSQYSNNDIKDKPAKDITLMQIAEGINHSISNETNYDFGILKNDDIVFLAISSKSIQSGNKNYSDHDHPKFSIKSSAKGAEPMKRALNKENGQMVGFDHKGEKVLASYRYIPEVEAGLVIKRHTKDIRQPYIHSALISSAISFLLIIGVYIILMRLSGSIFTTLSKNERKLKAALRSAIIGVWEYDTLTKEYAWSEEMYALFDARADESLDTKELFRLRIHSEDEERVNEALKQTFNDGRELDIEYRIVLKDDTVRHIKMYANFKKLTDIDNNFIVGTCLDITERIEQTTMLLQQSKLAAMGEMIGAIAHQWRQPLNAVAVLSQELEIKYKLNKLTGEEMQNLVGEIQKYLEYMSKTIDDFRDFFKPSKKKIAFDCKKAIDDSLNIVGSQLKAHAIELKIEEDCKDQNTCEFICYGFESEFKQVMINLINNAREAMEIFYKDDKESERVILIHLSEDSDNIKITIRNTGARIKRSVMDHLFEPYVSTKEEQQGTGLGLYMAKTIVERNMNGHLSAENIKNGVEFSIILPIS